MTIGSDRRLLGSVARGRLGTILIRYDTDGHPVYASDPRLGNRETRRKLAKSAGAQPVADAASRT